MRRYKFTSFLFKTSKGRGYEQDKAILHLNYISDQVLHIIRIELHFRLFIRKHVTTPRMLWKRPESVPIGQVWARFQGMERNGVPGKMYHIRDMEEKHRQQCLEMMLETFLRDEPLGKLLGIKSDPESIASVLSNWNKYLDQQVSLACFTDDGELVGFNVLLVRRKDDAEQDFDSVKGETWKKVLKTLITAEELVDVFSHYGVEHYLTASGLTVTVSHRGQDIGGRLIAAREPLCKALGIKAVCTVFTASASQALAKKCGHELLATLQYKDMIKYGIDLTGCGTPFAEVRGIKYDF